MGVGTDRRFQTQSQIGARPDWAAGWMGAAALARRMTFQNVSEKLRIVWANVCWNRHGGAHLRVSISRRRLEEVARRGG